MKDTPAEFVMRKLLQMAVLALPPLLLCIRPVVVHRCEPKAGAVSCTIEHRAGGLVRLSRVQIAGIRSAEGMVASRRSTNYDPARRETYTSSSTGGKLDLLGADGQVLHSEEFDTTVGSDAEWIAAAINRLARGGGSAPFLVWQLNWPTALFATLLLLLMIPSFIYTLVRRIRGIKPAAPETPAELRGAIPFFIVAAVIGALAWTLAFLGGLPPPLAEALGVPPGM